MITCGVCRCSIWCPSIYPFCQFCIFNYLFSTDEDGLILGSGEGEDDTKELLSWKDWSIPAPNWHCQGNIFTLMLAGQFLTVRGFKYIF
jgi:hypothetical protein